ncbi:hypothetical protein [Blastomonas sp. CCH1-A6]|uniref:hypothetical protein n=1 Tax=Blastomonas sp. CCH1-A6 TaxID=1768762 RepID=UPI0008326D44
MALKLFNRDATERKTVFDEMDAAMEYSRTVLNPLAIEAEAKLREGNEALFAEFEAELDRQRAGFSFSFKRHGDFLSIAITRAGNQDTALAKAETRWASTINLSRVRSISFREGRAPDMNGSFSWLVQSVEFSDEDGKPCSWGSTSEYPTRAPRRGKHVVMPHGFPAVPASRPFLHEEDDRVVSRSGFLRSGGGCSHLSMDFPRGSEDDAIHFNGLGMTLFAPFGLGAGMHQALLAELESAA